MASAFAETISDKIMAGLTDAEITLAADRELEEVRKVLDSLRTSRDCWCTATWKGTHDGRCQRARTLRQRLKVEAEKG